MGQTANAASRPARLAGRHRARHLGYYLASFLDFAGLAYITASLERLILYLNPTLVLLFGWIVYRRRITRWQAAAWGSAMSACCWCSAMS